MPKPDVENAILSVAPSSSYGRYRTLLWIIGGAFLGLLLGGGLMAIAILLGPGILGGALVAALVKFVGIPLAIMVGAAAGAALGFLATGVVLGLRRIIKSWKNARVHKNTRTLKIEAHKEKATESHRAVVIFPRKGLERGWFTRFSYAHLSITPPKKMASEQQLSFWQRLALHPLATRLANTANQRMRKQLLRNAPGERLQQRLVSSTSSIRENDPSRMKKEGLISHQMNTMVRFQGAVLTTDMKVMLNKIPFTHIGLKEDLERIVTSPQQADYIESVHVHIDLSNATIRERLIRVLNYYRVEHVHLEGSALASAPQLLAELRRNNLTIVSCSPLDLQDVKGDCKYMVARNSVYKYLLERMIGIKTSSREEVFEMEVLLLSLAAKFSKDPLIEDKLDAMVQGVQTVAAQYRTSPDTLAAKPSVKSVETPPPNSTTPCSYPLGAANSSAPLSDVSYTSMNPEASTKRSSSAEQQEREQRIFDGKLKNWRAVLGVGAAASVGDIKKAYYALSLRWHPDKHLENTDAAKEQFLLINRAYLQLTDPSKPVDTLTVAESLEIQAFLRAELNAIRAGMAANDKRLDKLKKDLQENDKDLAELKRQAKEIDDALRCALLHKQAEQRARLAVPNSGSAIIPADTSGENSRSPSPESQPAPTHPSQVGAASSSAPLSDVSCTSMNPEESTKRSSSAEQQEREQRIFDGKLKNWRAVLGVGAAASVGDIKKAYYALSLRWHPDKHLENTDAAKEQFLLINRAYLQLTDPSKPVDTLTVAESLEIQAFLGAELNAIRAGIVADDKRLEKLKKDLDKLKKDREKLKKDLEKNDKRLEENDTDLAELKRQAKEIDDGLDGLRRALLHKQAQQRARLAVPNSGSAIIPADTTGENSRSPSPESQPAPTHPSQVGAASSSTPYRDPPAPSPANGDKVSHQVNPM